MILTTMTGCFEFPFTGPKTLISKLNWNFVTKIVLTYCEKNCSCGQLLKFEAEGQELAKILRSLEQFVPTVKGQNNFW